MAAFVVPIKARAGKMDPGGTPKKTRITIETETRLILRHATIVPGWCPFCRTQVDVVTLDNDLDAPPLTAAQIQERFGISGLHSWVSATGQPEICLLSLFERLERKKFPPIPQTAVIPFDSSRRKRS